MSDKQLSELVAERVAGWVRITGLNAETYEWIVHEGDRRHFLAYSPTFATSADAVLPLLEKEPFDISMTYSDTCCTWAVGMFSRFLGKKSFHSGQHETLPRAICFALLKAHGVTIE